MKGGSENILPESGFEEEPLIDPVLPGSTHLKIIKRITDGKKFVIKNSGKREQKILNKLRDEGSIENYKKDNEQDPDPEFYFKPRLDCVRSLPEKPCKPEEIKVLINKKNESERSAYLLLPYYNRGDLLSKIKVDYDLEKKRVSPQSPNISVIENIISLLYQLKYMHSVGYCHLDLYAKNIMFHQNDGSEETAHIIDFDNSQVCADTTGTRLGAGGPIDFKDPYIYLQIDMDEAYNKKYDIYCMGGIIYYILTKKDFFSKGMRENLGSMIRPLLHKERLPDPMKMHTRADEYVRGCKSWVKMKEDEIWNRRYKISKVLKGDISKRISEFKLWMVKRHEGDKWEQYPPKDQESLNKAWSNGEEHCEVSINREEEEVKRVITFKNMVEQSEGEEEEKGIVRAPWLTDKIVRVVSKMLSPPDYRPSIDDVINVFKEQKTRMEGIRGDREAEHLAIKEQVEAMEAAAEAKKAAAEAKKQRVESAKKDAIINLEKGQKKLIESGTDMKNAIELVENAIIFFKVGIKLPNLEDQQVKDLLNGAMNNAASLLQELNRKSELDKMRWWTPKQRRENGRLIEIIKLRQTGDYSGVPALVMKLKEAEQEAERLENAFNAYFPGGGNRNHLIKK